MGITQGTTLGMYTIVGHIGAGGMGEVYLGRDQRLERDVAIKVLPGTLAGDPERVARFEREARLLATLNHPNIGAVFGFDCCEGVSFLAMEFIEGRTLAACLDDGQLDLDDALDICRQVAQALEAAHDKGIVHRDLKPGNIMVRPDGVVKVLDFGLAKAMSEERSTTSLADSPTITAQFTKPGVVLGTAAYMSPEQARGRSVDKRSDIWSFGVILYECLAGRRPFVGETASDLVASILKVEPAWESVAPATPPVVHLILRRCLTKTRDKRLRDIGDARVQIEEVIADPSSSSLVLAGQVPLAGDRSSIATTLSIPRGARAIGVVLGLALVLALAFIGAQAWQNSKRSAAAVQLSLLPPPGQRFDYRYGPPVISPDGLKVVFVARATSNARNLWLRHLDDSACSMLPGTIGAGYPFWSPDSTTIAFSVDGKLKRLNIDGGMPITICDYSEGQSELLNLTRGGNWSRSDTILFSSFRGSGLFKVSASGGAPQRVTQLQPGEFSHRMPWFLPDGNHFLFTMRRGSGAANSLMVATLAGGEPRELFKLDSQAVYVSGQIMFWRDDALRAQAFDDSTLELIGHPVSVIPEVRMNPSSGVAHFSVSRNGRLVYFAGSDVTARSQLVLRDRKGEKLDIVGAVGNYYSPALSPDGTQVAVDNSGVQNNGDIWIHSVYGPGVTRLSNDPADESSPVWSPDGTRIAYFSMRGGDSDIYMRDVLARSAEEVVLDTDDDDVVYDWTVDDTLIIGRENSSGGQSDLWTYSLKDRESAPLLTSPANESEGVVSPDGKWLAYVSNDTGRREVYIAAFADAGPRHRVSTNGGTAPRWRADGSELFFVAGDEMVTAVEIAGGTAGPLGQRTTLFPSNRRFNREGGFDVAPDGQTFIINTPVDENNAAALSVIINWPAVASP